MSLETLPGEILLTVCLQLDSISLQNLDLTSQHFHELIGPCVYRRVYATWDEIEQLSFPKMEHLHIKPHTARGEWYQSPKLLRLVDLAPHWTSLYITYISQSSGWLKYIGALSNIRKLEIRAVDTTLREFDFSHLAPSFPDLEVISLSNCSLEMPPQPMHRLKEVELYDCVWNFPNNISGVGLLTTLKITISENFRWFAWSERLEWEASHPPATLKCLHLNLLIGQRVNWLPLKLGSDCLEELQLIGFENFHHVSKLPRLRTFNQYSTVKQ